MYDLKARLTHPAMYIGAISVITLIFSTAGIPLDTLTSWEGLYEAIKSIVLNPYTLISIIGAFVGFGTDTSTKGFKDHNTEE